MTHEEHLTVVVPEPLAAEIRATVEAGEYATTGEAVGDAVQLWSSHRQQREPDVEALRRAWAAGKASGLHGPLAFDELRVEARKRLAAAKASSDRAGRGRLVASRRFFAERMKMLVQPTGYFTAAALSERGLLGSMSA